MNPPFGLVDMKPTREHNLPEQLIASLLAFLIIPFAGNLYGQGGSYAPLDPVALDQLVAPIALYPDSLVAPILTASTYPQQVTDAANWVDQTGGMPPEQRAAEANNMPWDPSVKALTAFPSVLDNMARNANWTSSLGNAYYNQPGDIMNAVQAMRVQAQQAGYLRSTPQQRVYDANGQIFITPVNSAVVYVPYYDPWRIYGAGFITPYPGFYLRPAPPGLVVGLGLGFTAGISVGLFGGYGWGYSHWSPNWGSGVVVYNHNTYISNSRTVINRGNFGAYNRGVFEHAGRGVPANFHATASFARGANVNRPAPNAVNRPTPGAQRQAQDFNNRPAVTPQAGRPQAAPAGRAQNSERPQDFSRPAAPRAEPGGNRPEAVRPQGHAAPERAAPPQSHAAPQGHAAPAPHGGGHEEHEHH